MGAFNGTLNSNEIFSALYNMIISQRVFADNVNGTYGDLADMCRVDGSLYGDTKLYYSTDVLKSQVWGNDAEATNLLALHRPKAPKCQKITLNIFRQISLTVDNYLSKRAWATEGAFSDFNSVMLQWIRETKRIYDSTLVNAYIGTAESNTGSQTQTITYSIQTTETHYYDGTDADNTDENTDVEATLRLKALAIANKLADILIEMKDVTRLYNDNQYLRSYKPEDLVVVWNSEAYNEITKFDLPTIFHKDGLLGNLKNVVLPARYFGTKNAADVAQAANDGTYRSLIECDYSTDGTTSGTITHVFPGDLIPSGTIKIPEGTESTSSSVAILQGQAYKNDSTIVFKIMHKDSVPFMSAFEVGTSFFNAKSLTENHYLTWGHNTLEYLANYPMVTVKGVNPS